MKTIAPKTLLRLLILMTVCFAPILSRANIVGPYTNDANTLFLFHLDEAPGGSVTTNVGIKGGNSYSVSEATASATPPVVTGMLGVPGYTNAGAAIGFGNAVTNGAVGTELGYDNNRSGAYQGDVNSGTLSADALVLSNLNIGNGGQSPFTLEALVAPVAIVSSINQEIICTDSDASLRGFQFRITVAGQLQFSTINPSAQSVSIAIPTGSSDPNRFVSGAWYHVAVTYDGTTLRLYWTRLDPSITADNQIGTALATIGTAFGAISSPLIIGNENRNTAGEQFTGMIDEVRISSVARAANQMQFFSPTVTISQNPSSQNVDYSQPVTFAGDGTSLSTLGYQWRFNSNSIAGATNKSYTIPSVVSSNAGFYDLVITNAVGNSNVTTEASLTVGAPNFLAHRYSFNDGTPNDSIGTANGTNFGDALETNGTLVLDGVSGTYMQLPGGMLTGLQAVTMDFWAALGPGAANDRVFDFGNTNAAAAGLNYLFFSPNTGGQNHLTITSGDSTFEQTVAGGGVLDGDTIHVTCVVDPPDNTMSIYTNGVLEATDTNLTVTLASLNNVLSYIGHSLYATDPYLTANIDEFRIYNGALSSNDVLLSDKLGTSNLISDGAVSIVHDAQPFATAVGQPATFSVVANGRQPILYQWYKNGTAITNATNATLTFTTALADNNAQIQLFATNVVGGVTDNAASSSVLLTVVQPPTLVWQGIADSFWNTTSLNWSNSPAQPQVAYAPFDAALLDDRASRFSVDVAQAVNPVVLTVNNSANAYSLVSSGQNGSITGAGVLVKQGSGTFTLDVTNNLTGGTLVSGGILQVGAFDSFGSLGTGATTNNATISFARSDAALVVPNAIHGNGTVSVDGGGSVTLSGSNDYTGPTLINLGILNLQNVSGLGSASAGTTVAGSGQLYVTLNFDLTNENLSLVGAGPDGNGALRKGGAGATTISSVVSLTGDTTISVDGGATLTLSNATGMAGGVVLTKAGTGTLALNTPNSYTGGTMLTGGILNDNVNGALGPGNISYEGASRIVLADGLNLTNSVQADVVSPGVATGLLMVNDNTNNTVTTVSGPLTINAAAANGGHFVGPTTSGYLNVTGPITMPAATPLSVRFGNMRFSGGGSYSEIQIRANTTTLGTNNGIATNAVADIGGNGSPTTPTFLDMNGLNQTLAGLKNTVTLANTGWVTNSSATLSTLTLDLGDGVELEFDGSIVGNVALTLKSGLQTLGNNGSPIAGLDNYTGNTLISSGSLILGPDANVSYTPLISLASGATLDASASGITVGASQTVAGSGTVLGNVFVNGTVAPGGASVGVLSFGSDVTLLSSSRISIKLNKALATNDVVAVTGTLTYGGTLNLSNLAGSLASGDQFTLFSAGASAGNFTSINGPGGFTFAFNPTNGVLSVSGTGVATNSTPITFGVSGNSLTLSWPTDHIGWILQAQTNTLAKGISTNWFDISGTAGTNKTVLTINPASPTVFYRLRKP